MKIMSIFIMASILPLIGQPSRAVSVQDSVSGVVWVMESARVPVLGAKIRLETTNGRQLEILTKSDGRYRIELREEGLYLISVEMKGLCAVHRAPFFWKPGLRLNFDFEMVICPNVNFSSVGDADYPGMYYKEVQIPVKESPCRYLVLAYGLSQRKLGKTRFESYVSHFEGVPGHLPVTATFDTLTITAGAAELDEKSETLTFENDVSVIDGKGATARTFPRFSLTLHGSEPQLSPCN